MHDGAGGGVTAMPISRTATYRVMPVTLGYWVVRTEPSGWETMWEIFTNACAARTRRDEWTAIDGPWSAPLGFWAE